MSTELLEDGEYETLSPPTDLRKKVRIMNKREAAKFDPVQAAEQAITRLSDNFGDWMSKETRSLLDAWHKVQENGLDQSTLDTLYHCAHNIKGQAQTLGYPLVGSVAANFCFLIEKVPASSALPLPLVEQYVEAIRAMVAEGAKDDNNATGTALLNKLSDVTNDYLAQVSR